MPKILTIRRALHDALHTPAQQPRLDGVSGTALRRTRRALRRALSYRGLTTHDSAIEELTDYFSQITPSVSAEDEQRADPADGVAPAGPTAADQPTIDMAAALLFHAHEQAATGPPSPALVAAAWLRSQPGRDLRHLELGSGTGILAQLLTGRGWSSTIAEISTELLDFARYRLQQRGTSAVFLDLQSEALPPDAFDVVTVFDVLDRVPDLARVVGLLRDALAPDGLLLTESALCTDPTFRAAIADAGLVVDAHIAGGASVLRRDMGIPSQRHGTGS